MTLRTTHYELRTVSGQAAMSMVLLIGGIVVLIGVALAFVSTSFINTALGFRTAQRATLLAIAGADDALLQLVRNTEFSSAGYQVPLGSDNATVSVAQNSPATGQVTIISTASIVSYTRKVKIVASVNPTTGQVNVLERRTFTE